MTAAKTGRGSTRTGRPAVLPGPAYVPPPRLRSEDGSLTVDFHGEDGRRRQFVLSALPLGSWHAPLAEALERRIGPSGTVRTLASARSCWEPVQRFMRFLAQLPNPPAHPGELTAAQMEAFYRHRCETNQQVLAWHEVRKVGQFLELPPLRDVVASEVLDFVARRYERHRSAGKPGYSDGELSRLVAAARRDAARIRDRIDAAEAMLEQFRTAPDTLSGADRARATALDEMAATGEVPRLPGRGRTEWTERSARAAELFLTPADLAPLMVLLVALTGRNIETVKELPAEHRVLEGRAVELRPVKRRRGPHRWFDTVTWEIGPPGRELHTPGGLYLLVHRLAARSRGFSGAKSLWSVWRNGNRAGVTGRDEHHDPFATALYHSSGQRQWALQRGLLADAPSADAEAPPLVIEFNRLKTSIDVRRTRQVGGHLPSAVRTNTIPVLFRHYLRGDPTTIAWAHEVVGEAFADAEQAALAAHQRTLRSAGGALRVIPGSACGDNPEDGGLDADLAHRAEHGQLDTAWSACTDPERHPVTDSRCEASFLDCFHCGNCLITTAHLPRLLGLLDALAERRQQMSEPDWWHRYGPAWAAIRHDVLTRFGPEEVTAAEQNKPTDALLHLIENPWEQP
ncbi:hypothetical protein [Streptomyces sp. NPDC088554]|uniref:hypothetical protein n=1 Tax=Streptomyces sp. NPDC088554 TaxID=3365865 RepID=UPI00380CF659